MSPPEAPRLVEPSTSGASLRGPMARILLIAGFAFTFVALVDMILLWFPAAPGNVAWEYATVGRTLDSMPLSALGLLLITYGVLRAPRRAPRAPALIATLFAVYAVVCLLLAFFLFTSAPAVLSQTPAEALGTVRRATIRNGIQAVVYPLSWIAIAVTALRSRKGGAS
ncbi:MAG: hypothetical protein R3195_07125 [Gemmatimonadota bacterium]|nr:hypothetical protein [Gemmatimonadota bacterium]